MVDIFQEMLWCVWRVRNLRRKIKKPQHPTGLVVAELDALVELQMLLREVGYVSILDGGSL